MRIIISPAKKMRDEADLPHRDLPAFVDRAERLLDWMRSLSYAELKKLWACSDAIAEQNSERLAHMDLRRNLVPALLAYDGIQYAYMAPAVFEDGHLEYVQEHLRILSGFYGVLKPFDGVVPYRLEMQAKAAVDGFSNLYDFWGDSLYREVVGDKRANGGGHADGGGPAAEGCAAEGRMNGEGRTADDSRAAGGERAIVNLASKEYSKAIERHLRPDDTFITCVFGELEGDKVVQKGVYAKMARGEMVRFLASIQAADVEQIKDFAWSDYALDEGRSTETTFVFVR